ncbi:hypothetical protein [Oceanobacter mangrovi]|uniref:hypothetical protein n=1 Tax=Oceanobacter mangrovi TaxID=2862510 RepID=UPI001C8D9F1D|nr:hypothetical protein [Oceanobacter mangrovi]
MTRKVSLVIFFVLLHFLVSCQKGCDENLIVMTYTKSVDKNLPEYEICESFTLSKADVVTYFSTAEEVNEYEFNQDAIILPCKYIGGIDIHGKQYDWVIYAGGAGYLSNNNGANNRYLCKEKCSQALPGLN